MKSAKAPRDVVVKTLMNSTEFLDFRDACAAVDKPQSTVLRDFAKSFVECFKNGKAAAKKPEWPGAGQKLAMFAPAPRAVFGGMPRMRLRL